MVDAEVFTVVCDWIMLVLYRHTQAWKGKITCFCSPILKWVQSFSFPQSVMISYVSAKIWRKCSAFSHLMYFMPKSSTTRQNWIGLMLCVHRPGVSLLCVYPFLASHCSRRFYTNNLACGSHTFLFLFQHALIPHQLLFPLIHIVVGHLLGYLLTWDGNIHTSEWGVKMKILDVHGHKFGIGCWYDTVQ